ncbi:hypothetical protein CFOL_v3_23026, partial [Cephalotus follicularis]
PFEAAYGCKPQNVLDLVPLPQEARVSEEGEAFLEHVRNEVQFARGDFVMVYLKKERHPKVTYHKLKTRKIGPCKILKKISSNAYVVELPYDLQINPIFNAVDLSDFYGFINDDQGEELGEWADQLPKKPKEVIEEVSDMKEACSEEAIHTIDFWSSGWASLRLRTRGYLKKS